MDTIRNMSMSKPALDRLTRARDLLAECNTTVVLQ